MARKKEFKSTLNTWQDHFDTPGLEAVKAVQRSIERITPPWFDSFIDATKLYQQIIKPVNLPISEYKTINFDYLNFFKEFHESGQGLQKVVDQIKFLQPPILDFNYDAEEELDATEFELLPSPEIIMPEQKILLGKQVSHIEKIITGIYKDHRTLHLIHHREFEEMMAEILKSRGFEVYLTKQTRDGGTDIIALQDVGGLPLKFLVECKKYAANRKIGVDIVRGFSHVINTQKANKGIIFTTSYFSSDAQKEQQKFMPHLLDLKDQDDVLAWVKKYVE